MNPLAEALRAILATDTVVVGTKYRFEVSAAVLKAAREALKKHDQGEHDGQPG